MKIVDDLTIDLPNPNEVLALTNQTWRARTKALFEAIPELITYSAKDGNNSVTVLYESKLGRDLFNALADILEIEVDAANERYASDIYHVEYDNEGSPVTAQDRTATICWQPDDD